MKNGMAVLGVAAAVMVVVVGVAQGMPLEPEPRQFVYQPGSPSVRLYPVHFDHYLKSSSGRVHLMKDGSPVMQVFSPNMLQPETGKTERPSDIAPTVTTMTPEMKAKTSTTSRASMATTSEPKAVSMMGGMMEAGTTIQPRMEEEDPVPQTHTEVPPHNLEDVEPVTDAGMMLSERDEDDGATATEMMPMTEDEEVETATEITHDEVEAMHDKEVLTDDATVTEIGPENEVATELPNLRELEAF